MLDLLLSCISSSGAGVQDLVTFNPEGGSYPSAVNVHIHVSGPGVTKLRYKIDGAAYTTVNGVDVTVNVPVSGAGHTLYADALSSTDQVLASNSDDYFRGD